MTSKKIAVLVLVLVGLVLALSMGIISAPDSSEGPVMIPAVKNASVSPSVGNYTDSFNYSVEVRFYEEALIELQIHHPIEDKFKPYGERKYTGSRGWQTLWWNGTIFGPEWKGKDVKYLFSWKGEELLFGEGPHIREELTWEFRNESVEPAYGYYNTPFTYSVEVKSNKEEEIHLEIFNMSSSKWEEPGEPKNYTENGTWHPLIWPNISNIASADCKGGHSSFRFFFIESEDKHESDTVDYPIIYPTDEEIFKNATEEIFKNATVDPHAGYYDTAFTYSVEANTSGDVYLLIYDISIDKWQKEINGTNTSDNRWEWKNISFSTACEGLASYKFVAGTHESGIFYGPTLKIKSTSGGGGGGGGGSSYKPYMLYENANVDPNDWTIKGAIESKTFYYRVEVDKKDMLILEIYNPSSNEWEEKGKGNGSKLKGEWGKWRHEWNVTLTLDKNWAGYGKYRFYPEKKEKYASQVYYGPEIKMPSYSEWFSDIGFSDTILKVPEINCTLNYEDGMWFKPFTYTADITHPDRANMTAVLFVYKPGSDDWEPVPWRKDRFNPIINSSMYNKTTNTTTVRWTIEKTEVFDEKDGEEKSEGGKKSKYYIWYWDGYTEYKKSQGYFYGPTLYVNHKPQVRGDPKIDPDPGSTHTTYTYKFGVNDTDGDPVYGYLTITDPLDVEHIVEGVSREGNLTFRVGPNLGIFTKLQENVESFTSRYRLEYQDEGMAINGSIDKAPPDGGWFTGPTVKLVDVRNVTKPNASPENGTYADEYIYSIKFYSSEENTLDLTLTIYDPSNSKDPDIHYGRLNISARRPASFDWKIKPDVFGPDDFDKTANFTITYNDSYTNRGKRLNGSGPYIQRRVPLSNTVPLFSIAVVPILIFVISLLGGISGLSFSIRGKFGGKEKK